jgi:hypothetical protein
MIHKLQVIYLTTAAFICAYLIKKYFLPFPLKAVLGKKHLAYKIM